MPPALCQVPWENLPEPEQDPGLPQGSTYARQGFSCVRSSEMSMEHRMRGTGLFCQRSHNSVELIL